MKKMENGILTNIDMKKMRYKLLYAAIVFVVVIYCVISVLPVLWILLSGFKDVKEIYSIPIKFIPKRIDLGKLATIWNEMKVYKYYGNTFIMSIGSVLATCIADGFAGYSLSRIKPKGSKFIFTLLFWIMLMPGTMRTVPLYMEFKEFPIFGFNMLNTYWPVWLISGANIFYIILFKNFFDGISSSLIEAAKIDGASDMKIYVKIILPLSLPVFMTVAIFTFNGQFGTFFWPYLTISKDELTVLGVFMFKLKSSRFTLDYQMLAILFSILPQLIIFIIFQKRIIGGVNIGGVKG